MACSHRYPELTSASTYSLNKPKRYLEFVPIVLHSKVQRSPTALVLHVQPSGPRSSSMSQEEMPSTLTIRFYL